MSLTVTAWRLADSRGLPAQCLVSERDGRWQLLIWYRGSLILWERCPTDDVALERACNIWQAMVEQGWTEPAV